MTRAPSVVVVDDMPDTVDTLGAVLAAHGFAVRTATDGAAALRLIAADPPDLVVTDLVMPGVGGLDLIRRVWLLFPRRPPSVVVVSGSGVARDWQRCVEAGADAFLLKPVPPAALIDRLRGLLAGR